MHEEYRSGGCCKMDSDTLTVKSDTDVKVMTEEYQIWCPKPLSRLCIGGNILIESLEMRPNAWWRFWQRLLLGWTWEEL